MSICYKCKLKFNNTTVKMHDEHIIQNALGGKLVAPDILCEKCGELLGRIIDDPFSEELTRVAVLLNLARDRGNGQPAKVNAIFKNGIEINDEETTFKLNKDFSVITTKPVFTINEEGKTLVVFGATKKQALQYAKSNQIKNFINKGYKLKLEDNAATYIESLTLDLRYESPEILLGILKIAIGFSLHKGISYSILENRINEFFVCGNNTNIKDYVWQYYPTTNEEMLYETNKSDHEDWYPNHQIYLYNINNNLFCYIELFGVIQKYVHLSDNYQKQNILKKYIQKTAKWKFNKDDWIAKDPSELDILARQFGIPLKGNIDFIQKQILYKAESRSYNIPPESQIEKVKSLMHHYLLFSAINPETHPIVEDLKSKARTAKDLFNFNVGNLIKEDPLSALELAQKNYNSFRISNGNNCCATHAKQVSTDKKKKYCAYKAYDLLNSIGVSTDIRFNILTT